MHMQPCAARIYNDHAIDDADTNDNAKKYYLYSTYPCCLRNLHVPYRFYCFFETKNRQKDFMHSLLHQLLSIARRGKLTLEECLRLEQIERILC